MHPKTVNTICETSFMNKWKSQLERTCFIILVFLCKQSVSGSRKKVLNNAIKFVCFTYFLHQRSPIKIFKELTKVKNKYKTSGQNSRGQGSISFWVKFLPELSSDSDVTASPGMSWNMSGDTRGDGKMATESVSISGIPPKSARNSASQGKLFPREISIPLEKKPRFYE